MKESRNISKLKRERMINFLEILKEKNSDDDSIRAINEIETQINDKKYGLIWEEHEENVDIQLENKIPVFNELNDKNIINSKNNEYNFLLEGDNLHSLYLLEKTHRGKIDFIYIDPPYNTGNKDFVYNDKYIEDEDGYKHSKWLSFMERRLKIAHNLIKNDGVTFISIDKNEFAQLKLLCDEIYGEEAFVTIINVEMSATQGMKVKAAKSGNIVKNGEYIMVYRKDGQKNIGKTILNDPVKYDSHYNLHLIDKGEYFETESISDAISKNKEIIEELNTLKLLNNNKLSNNKIPDAYEKSVSFNNWINKNSEFICRVHDSVDVDSEMKEKMKLGRVYRYSSSERDYLVEKDNNNKIFQMITLNEKLAVANDFYKTYGPTKIRGDWWAGFYLDMGNVSKEGGIPFNNGKKPVRLIKQLLQFASDKNSIVLDFFAGSGTTGQAVLELNKEDGGNRKFILCTNNEISDDARLKYLVDKKLVEKPPRKNTNNYLEWEKAYLEYINSDNFIGITSKEEYQKIGICKSVTYPRLKNVFSSNKVNKANLKYFITDWVDRKVTDYFLQPQLCKHVKEMIELENMLDVDDKENILILNSDDYIEKFLTNKNKEKIKNIWINEELVFSDVEWLKLREYNVKYVPRIYFSNELKEVGE